MSLVEAALKRKEIVQSKAEIVEWTVLDIVDQKPIEKNGMVYNRVMIVTKEAGNQFCLANVVRNRQTVFPKEGLPAKFVLTPNSYKDANGNVVESYNVASVTLHAVNAEQEAKINIAAKAGMVFSV